MTDAPMILAALKRSSFRRRFALGPREREYLRAQGLDRVLQHAARFIEERLAPATPENDGSQTPMRGHPVFIAQHATATCCRKCLAKWHGIPMDSALRDCEKNHVLGVIRAWLCGQGVPAGPEGEDSGGDEFQMVFAF